MEPIYPINFVGHDEWLHSGYTQALGRQSRYDQSLAEPNAAPGDLKKVSMVRLTLNYVWKQKSTPVVLRRTGRGEKLRVRLPFADDNRQWLRNGRRTAPEWIGGNHAYWELPKSWFNDFVDRTLRRYGKVYIIQPFREQEICARACQEAWGHECQCSCMGANHGMGNDGSWFEVSDTFSTRWGERELACRLLTAR